MRLGERIPDTERCLRRHPHGEPPLADPARRGPPFGSIGTAATRWFTNRPSTTSVGLVEDRRVVTEVELDREVRPVFGEQQRRVVVERCLGIDHRRQRVVVDDHHLGRVDGLRPRLGDDRRDDVADEADGPDRQRRPRERRREHDEALDGWRLEVAAGVHADDTRHRLGLARVDRLDPGVSDRRTHEDEVRDAVRRRGRRSTWRHRGGPPGPRRGARRCRGSNLSRTWPESSAGSHEPRGPRT